MVANLKVKIYKYGYNYVNNKFYNRSVLQYFYSNYWDYVSCQGHVNYQCHASCQSNVSCQVHCLNFCFWLWNVENRFYVKNLGLLKLILAEIKL